MSALQNINIEKFECGDWTLAVLLALRSCNYRNANIIFPKGTYEFFSEKAFGKYSAIPNHDYDGYRKYAFYLGNCSNIKFAGEQAEFVFHGDILPFFIENSQNISIAGISINFSNPCYASGTITDARENSFSIALDDSETYKVINKWLFFKRGPLWGMVEYDCSKKKKPFSKRVNLDEDNLKDVLSIELSDKKEIIFHGKIKQVPHIGNKMILRYGKRDYPAIYFSMSSNININNIEIHQARGMGVIVEACHNIKINKLKVIPGEKHFFSTCADAVHLVNCSGDVSISKCVFENQLDDSINIHGIYSIIDSIIDCNTILVKLEHGQHLGSIIAVPGNSIRLVKADSLEHFAELKVRDIKRINSRFCLISFSSTIPKSVSPGMALENISLRPDKVNIRNCISRNNNPRGILISTGQEVVIEDNYISSPEAAIRISGDANSWFESGPVEKVIIRNNHFDHCNYISRNPSKAIIDIAPEIKKTKPGFFYHGEIIINDNEFTDFTGEIIHGRSFINLTFTGNKIQHNNFICEEDFFNLKHCKFLQINNNLFQDKQCTEKEKLTI